jgi:hypothetical protein
LKRFTFYRRYVAETDRSICDRSKGPDYFLSFERPCRNSSKDQNSTKEKNNLPSDGIDMTNCTQRKRERMAYRYGNRDRLRLFPSSIEEYAGEAARYSSNPADGVKFAASTTPHGLEGKADQH